MKKIILTLLILSGFNTSFAHMEKATKEMGQLIGKEVHGLDSGLEENLFFETEEAVSPFSFEGFELLTVTSLGIEVPLLAGLEIFVEMEMFWGKSE